VNDEVKHLPGWDGPLPSRQYSGFVSMGVSREEGIEHELFGHYILVESEGNPASDPLLVWSNGGPGSSSMFGLMTEFGPFQLTAESLHTTAYNETTVPSLFYNQYAWSTVANVLIINTPAPVGFSYCTPAGPSGNENSCGSWNDTKAAVHNAIFLENWAEAWPEFLTGHKWFLIGESYAGVYMPSLLRELLRNKATSKVAQLVEGLAIGDGCMGHDVMCPTSQLLPKLPTNGPGPWFRLKFLHGHGQFSDKLYEQIRKECPRDMLIGYGVHMTDPHCISLLEEVTTQIGTYFPYNLYDDCWYQNGFGPPAPAGVIPTSRNTVMLGGALNDYQCGGSMALYEWVHNAAVKKALHVTEDAFFFSGDEGAGFTYNMTEPNLLPFYKEIIGNSDIRVLIYNGDVDPGVNSFATQNWTSHLGFKETEEWRPWTVDDKSWLGGYVTRYEHDFDFLTVRGAGHMVPEFKPKATLEFLSKWLNHEEWDRYQPGTPAFI